MGETHRLLDRQLRRCGIDRGALPTPSQWRALLASVARTYVQADQDRYTMERSLTISSKEMQQLYDDLRRTSESRLMKERDRLEDMLAILDATLEAAIEGVLVVDRERRVLRHNRRFVEIWSIDEQVLKRGHDDALLESVAHQLVDPEAFAERVEALYDDPRRTSHDEIPLRDGRVIDRFSAPIVRHDGAVVGRVWFFRDVTDSKRAQALLTRTNEDLERRVEQRTAELSAMNADLVQQVEERTRAEAALRNAEKQLRHAQKMEAIGRLAGGIAHDFNNMLCVVLSSAHMLRDGADALDQNAREDVDQITLAAERSADLTRQLLAFSRQQVLRPESIDLIDVVRELEKMLRRLIGENIELSVETSNEPCPVRLDRSQISQVLLNLAVNARDAMPDGGKLTIVTGRLDASTCEWLAAEGARGPHVSVQVSDTGQGMDQATLARIFEPFFTTKERGRGTGLGLATVYGVVRQSDGHIHVESNPGAGTRFTICFPELQERSEAARDRKVSEQPPSRSGTILLVEDEEMVRRAAHAILTRRGYDVIQATGGEEALAIYGRHGASIDLVLTDVVMPGMTGGELASKLSRKDPDLRVVFMSGYPSDVKSVSLVPQEAFVAKPFTPATLVATVRAALDTQTSPRRRGNWRSQLPAD